MITNTGKTLVSKYLTGQAPSYASYLAIGIGSQPRTAISYAVSNKNTSGTPGTAILTTATHDIAVGDYITVSGLGYGLDGVFVATSGTTGTTVKYATTTTWSGNEAVPSGTGLVTKNYSTKTALDFEVARFPIISPRGYVTESGISKIVLTGEIPTETRFEITEVGVFSAASNPSAISNDSRILYNFDSSEDWKYYDGSAYSSLTLQTSINDGSGNIVGTYDPAFLAGADNVVFSNYSTRLDRQERPRFGTNTYFLRGDFDKIPSIAPGSAGSTKYLQITNNIPLDLSQNSSNDEIRLAFSVVSKTMATAAPAGNVVVMLRFIDSAAVTSDMVVNIAPTISTRYQVASVKLSAFTTATGFNWANIQKVQVYSSVYSSGTTTLSTDHYVALDAIRLENVSTLNSLYGLTGYSPVINTDSVTGAARPIVKEANVPNLAEFRFVMDVT